MLIIRNSNRNKIGIFDMLAYNLSVQVVCPTQRGSNNKRGPISEIRMNKIRCRYYSVISFPKEQNNHLRKPKRGDALGGGKDRIAKQRIKKMNY